MTADSSDPIFLTVEDILELHHDQLRLFGGSAGIRNRGALGSAVATPASTLDAMLALASRNLDKRGLAEVRLLLHS